jgi:hypothetical protein
MRSRWPIVALATIVSTAVACGAAKVRPSRESVATRAVGSQVSPAAVTSTMLTKEEVTQAKSLCSDEQNKGVADALDALEKADSDTFADLYQKVRPRYDRQLAVCTTAGSYNDFQRAVDNRDYVVIAYDLVAGAPQAVKRHRDRLGFAIDEASIGRIRDEAKARMQLAESAYYALAQHFQWRGKDYPALTDADRDQRTQGLANPATWSQSAEFLASDALRDAEVEWRIVAATAETRTRQAKSLCGGFDANGGFTSVCAAYGVTAASLSQVWLLGRTPAGMTGGRFVNVAVPFIGMRIIPFPKAYYLAFDIVAFSAYFSATTPIAPKSAPCTKEANALERGLPCEANAEIRPYAALAGAFTVGARNLAYVSISPVTLGWASIGGHGTHFIYGVTVSSVTLTGTF